MLALRFAVLSTAVALTLSPSAHAQDDAAPAEVVASDESEPESEPGEGGLVGFFVDRPDVDWSLRVYLGLGGAFHQYQDARYSDLVHRGVAFRPELGARWIFAGNYLYAHATGFWFDTEQPNIPESASGLESELVVTNNVGVTVRGGYLRHVWGGLYLGGSWDVFDHVTRTNSALGNGGNSFLSASDLFASARYVRTFFGDMLSIDLGAGLGLGSLIKYAPGFSSGGASHQAQVTGNLSFEDARVRDPFSLDYLELKPFWQQPYVRFSAEVLFLKYASVAYHWRMRTFSDSPDHPVTTAEHMVTLRGHFPSFGF